MARTHNYFVYIIECSDGLYYTGVTNNLERRLREHNDGIHPTSFTFKRRPVKLRYWVHFTSIFRAIRWKQLKGWSRKKKEALFRDDWDEIKELAKCRCHSSTGSE